MLRKLTEFAECTSTPKAYRDTYLRTPKSGYTGNITHPYLALLIRDLNQYKIVVPLFGAAYAAPNIGTTILY